MSLTFRELQLCSTDTNSFQTTGWSNWVKWEIPQTLLISKAGKGFFKPLPVPTSSATLGWENNTVLFPRWPWKQKSLLSAKAVAWSWYSSNDLKILFLWSSFTKIAYPHSTMSVLLRWLAQGTSFLCPSPPPYAPGTYPKYQQSCFPSKGRRLSTSFSARFCWTVQRHVDHRVSLQISP